MLGASWVCPTSTLAENWIKVKTSGTWNDTKEVSGTFSFDTTTNTGTVTHKYALANQVTDLGTQTVGSGSCAGGLLTIGSPNPADLFLTAGGGAIVHTNPGAEATSGDEIIFALPPTAAAVTPGSLAGNYIGLVFASGSGSNKNFPAKLTLAAGGGGVQGSGYQITDVTTGATSAGGAKVIINASGTQPGFVTGTIDTTGPTGGGTPKNLTCMVQPGTHTVLGCVGEDQTNNFFSIILTSI